MAAVNSFETSISSSYLTPVEIAGILFKKRMKFLNMIRKYVWNIEDANDLFQECCMEAIGRRIDRNEYPETYIGNLINWRAIDRSRQSKGNILYPLTSEVNGKEVSLVGKIEDKYCRTDKYINESEHQFEIKHLINIFERAKLTSIQREIIDLKYLQEKKIREIVQILGIPDGTIKAEMFRGIEVIRQYVDENEIHCSFLRRTASNNGGDSKTDVTGQELQYIKSHWQTKKRLEILHYLNLRRRYKMNLSGLKRIAREYGLNKKETRKIEDLSEFELQYIRDKFTTKSDRDISRILSNKPKSTRQFDANTIYHLRMQMGLMRTREEIESIKAKNIEISDGSVRDSLGRYVDRGLAKKSKSERLCYDLGHISLVSENRASGPIKRAKIKVNGRWKYLYSYIWQAEHGEIPKGYKLVYKDRNPDESDLERVVVDNMELISIEELSREIVAKYKVKQSGTIVHKSIYARPKKDKSRTLIKKQFHIKDIDGTWMPLMHYKWILAYGEIPQGYRVRYKGEDQNEETIEKVEISNMELVKDHYSVRVR